MKNYIKPLKKFLNELQIENNPIINPLDYWTKEIVSHHTSGNYLSLVSSIISLAFWYDSDPNDPHYIKTIGLFNVAINIAQKKQLLHSESIITIIHHCALVTLKKSIINARIKLNKNRAHISLNLLSKQDVQNKSSLIAVREKLSTYFLSIDQTNQKEIALFYTMQYKLLRKFHIQLIEQCIDFLEPCKGPIALIYMGSYSRTEMTPYSDIEFFIIIENKEDAFYAQKLTELMLLKILELRETLLAALRVPFLENMYVVTPDGFSFDSYVSQACKTPLGKKTNDRKLSYRLIGTPESLSHDFWSLKGYSLDSYLPQMLRFSRFMYGARSLYERFKYNMYYNTNLNSHYYSYALMKRDFERYIAYLDEVKKMSIINHKRYLSRPLTIFLDNFLILFNLPHNIDSGSKIDILYHSHIINFECKNFLYTYLHLVQRLQYCQHTKFASKKIFLTSEDNDFSRVKKAQGSMHQLLLFFDHKLKQHEIYNFKKSSGLTQEYIQYQNTNLIKSKVRLRKIR